MLNLTELEIVLEKLVSEAGRSLSTFIMAGAGSSQADNFSPGLQLPLAASLRDQLLFAKYGQDSVSNLQRFQSDFGIIAPSPDQVWQALMRSADNQESYADQLYTAFSPDKPIPPAYHMLARWFYSNPRRVAGIATTNFDYQFGKAFHNVAQSLNKRHCVDYNIA